ncbi:MAG: hypothetical protein Q7R68_10945 [Nitrospirales bacterium]|nr:hypothetical protein [Nitrospirales bacterium]
MGQVLSSVNQAIKRLIGVWDRWLVDPSTNTVVGIANPNAGGQDTFIYPIQLTDAQIDAPTADMLADIQSTYALNVAPYTRYRSTGSVLQPLGSDAGGGSLGVPSGITSGLYTIPAGWTLTVDGPFEVSDPGTLIVEGTLTVT